MKTTLRVAELEAAEAALWYESQREGLGEEFLNELDAAMQRIESEPKSFARLEQLSGAPEIRRCLLSRFPYLVIFRLDASDILILAITHVRRRPLYWMDRLK